MAKQDDYIRTQVRLELENHHWIKEYASKKNISVNQAINNLVNDGLHDDIATEETFENREHWASMIGSNMEKMEPKTLLHFYYLSTHLTSRG